MSHVWVIECGSYSDYRVVGAYTTKAGADTVAAAINAGDCFTKATVAKWELNPALDEINAGRKTHIVHMRYDGTVERAEQWEMSAYDVGGSVDVWRRSTAPAYRGQGVEDCIMATVWATDVQHAIKITNEHRARLIASGKFKPPKEPHP
jgi:hypothetical protein